MKILQEPLVYLHFAQAVLLVVYIHRAHSINCEYTSIGVESKAIIPDGSFTASSYYDERYYPYQARLLYSDYGWDAKNPQNDLTQYLQIDLGMEYFICAIATKAGRGSSEYVKTYKIKMSVDNTNWTDYQEDGQNKVFTGNSDGSSVVKQSLNNQPFMRYIRIYPITYHRFKTIKLALYGYAKFEVCTTNPLGMESRSIADKQLSASTSLISAANSRLNSLSSWCPGSHDPAPFLQVDLESDHVICAIATQGNRAVDQWVTSYYVSVSSDGSSWERYKENSVLDRMFYGNYDRSSIVKRILYQSVTARFVRVEPKTSHGSPCLRLEIYGYKLQSICRTNSVGVPSPLIIPDHRFTASSTYSNSYKPSKARLDEKGAWQPYTHSNEFLQVDLNQIYRVCTVRTQGHDYYNRWVKNYKIQYSIDNKQWSMYGEVNGVDKIFQGNSDRSTTVDNSIKYPFKAKFVRIRPTSYYSSIALRLDIKGTAEACTFSLGVENRQITDSQLTSSSNNPTLGRLYATGSSWCAVTTSIYEYIQVDLIYAKTVTGVALQGNPSRDKWVKSFILRYSYSGTVWYDYKEGQATKTFTGNTNRNDVIVNWLTRPIGARYVRIVPRTSNGGHCLRFDLYGCDYVVTPKVSINIRQVTVPSRKGSFKTLTCTLTGAPTPALQWLRNGTEIPSETEASYKVLFNSADDVVAKYRCTRESPTTRPVVCSTNYTCRAFMPSSYPVEQSAVATINLNVPRHPTIQLTSGKRSIGVTWSVSHSDDVGTITGYRMEFLNITWVRTLWLPAGSNPTSGTLNYLKPSTNYTIRMNAVSVVGVGLWSSVNRIQTLIAEPEATPSIVSATAESSTSIKVTWMFSDYDKVNGPMQGFRVTFTDQDGNKQSMQVNDVKDAVLNNLKKYTRYSISVCVVNSLYSGRESYTVHKMTRQDAPDCSPRIKSVQALSSTSIRVSWDPLPNTSCRNGVLKYYKIVYRKLGDNNGVTGYADAHDVSKDIIRLQKYTFYQFTVLGVTVKDGPASNAVSGRTLQDAPSAPTSLQVKLLPPQNNIRVPRVQITWDKPTSENGIITRYKLMFYYDNDIANQKHANITDISALLTHVMDVFGEATFRCKMSAVTIKEGPATQYSSSVIPVYAPSVAPRNIHVSKISETVFSVGWQPLTREEANAIKVSYKITWTLNHVGRSKRGTGKKILFTKTTQDSQYTLSNLRPCAEYVVHVAGLTSGGLGPNTTSTITTSKPGEPYNLRSTDEGQTFITLKWEKPRGVNEDVKDYKIYLKGSKPTYWTSYSESKEVRRDGSQTTIKIEDLQPGTRYEFWIIASTVCGESNRSVLSTASTHVDKPRKPQGKTATLTDSLNVTLWEVQPYNGPISWYQVIVISNKQQQLTELPVNISNYEDSRKKGQSFYITGQLSPNQLKSSKGVFIIGDNKMYNGYKNVPLKKGAGTHTIAERAITTSDEGKLYSSDIAHVATITLSPEATKKAKSETSSSSGGVAAGVVIALLVIIIIVALLVFKYKRNRDKRKSEECSHMPLDDVINDTDGVNESSSHLISQDGTCSKKQRINQEEKPQYVNVGLASSVTNDDDIYDEARDADVRAMTKKQFLEYMRTLKATNYEELKDEFKSLLNTHVYPVELAKKQANKKKNRYANIVTYDHSRVMLTPLLNDENSDYVNASFIKGYNGDEKTYIATQGPKPETVADFWQMIWEQNTFTIVMLTNLKEGQKTKCHQYWPDTSETHRDLTVTTSKAEVFPDYTLRTIQISKANTNESRQVNHFQFNVWPDKGVPHYSTAVLGLRRHVRSTNPAHAGPLVVHCSAGVGRTGAYIVIDAMLERAKRLENINISDYVTAIRRDRPYMVQTDEQYVFIHLALYEALTCGNTEIPAHKLQTTTNKLSAINQHKNISGYALEFERLNRVTEEYAKEECSIGASPEHIDKNRYKDKIALNRSRVILSKSGETVSSSYINASHVDAYKQRNAFLVTQSPLGSTIEDFWIMVVNYEVHTIVMLNDLQDETEQFVQYWPDSGTASYGRVTVEAKDIKSLDLLTTRRFQVTYDTTTIQVQHIQMSNWKDKCSPDNPLTVLDLLNEVELSQRQTTHSPIVVQCSDGIGRSGTLCAVYSIIERAKQEQTVDVFQAVKRIRENRPGAVETLSQYVFCYEIAQRYIDSFSDYANFMN